MIRSGIYEIRNLINGKVYIGSSQNLKGRQLRHFRRLQKEISSHPYLQNAWNKHGEENFKFSILIYCSVNSLLFYEQQFLDKRLPEYNCCPIAGGTRGYKHSDEARKNMSKAQMGNTKGSGNKGKTRQKISIANTGKKHTKEARQKIGKALLGNMNTKGRSLTKEHKQKISSTLKERPSHLKGGKLSKEHRHKISKGVKKYYQKRRLDATKN